ncbi:Protein saf4 [Dipsacomyces acuminosporus]|nr:Protein saf4 [Dipsacomyces acuminosporus]
MAERRATNKYYPPDWDPSKGSVNAFVGQHPLRDRARKLGEGILIIRFELPFSIWCGGCNCLLATGLRFNAEKKRIGNYYSTPIWSFRMKCRSCGQWFEIHTNPKESRYEVVRGARKKAEPQAVDGLDASEDAVANEVIDLATSLDSSQSGSLRQLEVAQHKKRKAEEAATRLGELQRLQDRQWKSSDQSNANMRRVFREGRKIRERDKKEADEIQTRTGIALPILPADPRDSIEASAVEYCIEDEKGVRKRVKEECIGRRLFEYRAKPSTDKRASAPRRESSGQKTRLAFQQLSRHDPFAAGNLGKFGSVRGLGIKKSGCSAPAEETNSLAELSSAYADAFSSSDSEQ